MPFYLELKSQFYKTVLPMFQVWVKNNTHNNSITISNGTSQIMMAQSSQSTETPLSTGNNQNQNP